MRAHLSLLLDCNSIKSVKIDPPTGYRRTLPKTIQMQKSSLSSANMLDDCYDSRGSLDELSQQSQLHHRRMVPINEVKEQDRKLVAEFCHLLEKSKQLFNGLR